MGHFSRMIIKLVTWGDEVMPPLCKNAGLFSTCYKSSGFSKFRPQTHLDLSWNSRARRMEVNMLVLTLPPVLGDKALCLGPRNLMSSTSKVKLNP